MWKKISFLPQKEIEADGIFKINGFDSSIFNSNEVTKIYSNVLDDKKDFDMAILEVKLNRAKIYELIKQIKKDDNIFGRILKKKIIYLGFINSPTVDSNSEKNFIQLQKINCVIFGIKESKFAEKNVLKPIDWDLLKEVKGLKKKLDKIELLLQLYLEKEPKKEKKFINKKKKKSPSQKQKYDDDSDDDEAYE